MTKSAYPQTVNPKMLHVYSYLPVPLMLSNPGRIQGFSGFYIINS